MDEGHSTGVHLKTSLTASPTLLPEIWQLIFDADPLIGERFSNIRLTCKTFAILTRPMAFRYFCLHLNTLGQSTVQPMLPSKQDVVARSIARLEFWATDETARHVRRIELALWNLDRNINEEADRVLGAFFQVLSRFANVQTFNCPAIPFDDFALDQLCRLKNLRTLELTGSSIIAANPARARAALRLRSLTYMIDHTYYHKNNGEWLLVAHLDHIQHVGLSIRHVDVAKNFLHVSMTMNTAQHITALCIPYSNAIIGPLVLALLRTQPCRLRRLEIQHVTSEAADGPIFESVSVPSLHTYIGPHQCLLAFLPGEGIQTIQLRGWGGLGYADPTTLAHTLRSLPNSIANLEKLHLEVTCMARDVLEIICARFLHLRHFTYSTSLPFDLSDDYMERDDAWNALCTVTLPAQLEVLDLWFQHFPSAENVTTWSAVQDRLLQKHSALQRVTTNIC
ncbi:hypothetical protein PILCRDRAFT_456872 [Piloderma croceum F 1598]|uniref:F-box domain-containing protein n=1 Tax=Piloderma croceum (strain F 1598) TaxID=765440 RepID=A0A0C3FSX4_PILCF|nr:hypothetical protein PILCRDRAFT_456872 [Piloderma croceum F 1598]